MKVVVSFELDLSKHPGFNVGSIAQLRGSLQNLSSFFHELHCLCLDKKTGAMANQTLDPKLKEAVLQHYDYDIAISEQLFNNYRVQGTTEDGHKFDSTHQEPGYKETMIIDGVETRDF